MTSREFSPRDLLLGRLSEEDRDRADERSLSDPCYFESIIAEEQRMVEAYAVDELNAADRHDFERQCSLRPELGQRVLVEQLLRKRTRDRSVRGNSWARIALPLAASVAVIAWTAAWHYSTELAQERRVAAVRAGEWKSREAELQARIGQMQPAPHPESSQLPPQIKPVAKVLASFLVLPYSRGGNASEEPRFDVPAGPGLIELQFNIGTDTAFAKYRIRLRQRNGGARTVTARAHIVNSYRVVSATIPNDLTREGHFEATVMGESPGMSAELIESYAFALAPGQSSQRIAK